MRYAKLLVLIYAFIFVTSIIYAVNFNPSEGGEVKNLSTSSNELFVVPIENYGYAPMLKHLIDNATESVYVSMEILSDYEPVKTLLDSLIAAHNRGVDVKVICEGDISSNKYGVQYLENGGVEVKVDNTEKFIHTKMIVIDGKVVYVGSHNWSPYALGKNNEYGILIFNSLIANFYQNYFNSLWVNSSKTPQLSLLSQSSGELSIKTTYDGYTYNALKDLINSAKHRLYISVYTMAYYSNPERNETLVDNLVNEIIEKKDIAKVVLDDHDSEYAYNYLQANDVSVEYDSSSVITHLKLVIADDTVYVGDANWDYGYLDNETHTVGVIIENKTVADFFANYFLQIWKYKDNPYYIPDGFVDKWSFTANPGDQLNINVFLANGGYKNDSSFYLIPGGNLNASINENLEWYRENVYDWRNETMRVEIPDNASGYYTVHITLYGQDKYINYTMYFTIYVENSVPEFESFTPLIIAFTIIFAILIKKKDD